MTIRASVVAMAVLAAGLWNCACGDEVHCAPSGVRVLVAAGREADVDSVSVSGACEATITCTSASSDPCSEYSMIPTREGSCRIRVTWRDGSPEWSRDVEIEHPAGCCAAGLYPTGEDTLALPGGS